MIKLSESQVAGLVNQPESGMGYQVVEVEFPTQIRKGTVYNAELLLWEHEPQAILSEPYDKLIERASVSEARQIRSIRVVVPPRAAGESAFGRRAEASRGKPATEGEPTTTLHGELFARFTAYRNDRRITPKKGLMPGTYGTTDADARIVKSGSEAVERYALPDPKPATYRYRIDPRLGTVYRQGVVQPAYGHKGGGVEVIFDNGTQDNTVSLSAVLPP
ncbi:hypothetical protein HS121_01940 [bacterium]|nr:hypothetical protein [bacterium]